MHAKALTLKLDLCELTLKLHGTLCSSDCLRTTDLVFLGLELLSLVLAMPIMVILYVL